MTEFFNILEKVTLFAGIAGENLSSTLSCLQAQVKTFKRGQQLLSAGNKPSYIGIVLTGRLHIVKEDIAGNRNLLAALTAKDIFGEALCCAGVDVSPVTVLADAGSQVLMLEFSRLLSTCPNNCAFHRQLISNMLKIVAQKNLYLQNRIDLVCTRSVRAKTLKFLTAFAKQKGVSFKIPYSREEMADYLSVERSALSHELMRMKKERLIDYRKNIFTLY